MGPDIASDAHRVDNTVAQEHLIQEEEIRRRVIFEFMRRAPNGVLSLILDESFFPENEYTAVIERGNLISRRGLIPRGPTLETVKALLNGAQVVTRQDGKQDVRVLSPEVTQLLLTDQEVLKNLFVPLEGYGLSTNLRLLPKKG